MTGTTCPEGHVSSDPEWCDVCGARLGAPGTPTPPATPVSTRQPVTTPTAQVGSGPTPPAPAAPAGPTVACAHCGTLNDPEALFCESCGYDFTTGQAPPPPPAPVTPAPTPSAPSGPAEFALDVSVDPAWYALQGTGSQEPCPAAVTVRVDVSGTTVLIGRTSAERSVTPEVALDGDPGVSRRHAQLVRGPDGTWSAVDLGSMNGTFVVADGAVPTSVPAPLVVGEPVPLAEGAAVFVGAWTRVVLVDLRAPTPDPAPDPTADPSATTDPPATPSTEP